MQQFKISPAGFKEIRKQILLRVVPFVVIILAAVAIMNQANPNNKAKDINILPFYIPFMLIVVGFGMYRGINKRKKLLESYTLVIDNNLVTRYQLNTPTISLYFNDIKEITKDGKGNFTIKGSNNTDHIFVLSQIENHSELEATLNTIKPITLSSGSVLQKLSPLLGLLTVGLMICVYAVNNKIIVAISGTLFTLITLWSVNKMRLNKNIDRKTKRNMWWVVFVLVSVIGVTILKLVATPR